MFIDINDYIKSLSKFLDNNIFVFEENPIEIIIIPCDLSTLISRIHEIRKYVKTVIIEDIYKMDDRFILMIKSVNSLCLVMKFINIGNNIYEVHSIIKINDTNIQKLAEI